MDGGRQSACCSHERKTLGQNLQAVLAAAHLEHHQDGPAAQQGRDLGQGAGPGDPHRDAQRDATTRGTHGAQAVEEKPAGGVGKSIDDDGWTSW